jgi:thymidylate synthase (FAD)
MGGLHLSAKGLDVVKRLLAGENVEQKASGLSAREWREMMAALGRDG